MFLPKQLMLLIIPSAHTILSLFASFSSAISPEEDLLDRLLAQLPAASSTRLQLCVGNEVKFWQPRDSWIPVSTQVSTPALHIWFWIESIVGDSRQETLFC